jgi:hypothetical protein
MDGGPGLDVDNEDAFGGRDFPNLPFALPTLVVVGGAIVWALVLVSNSNG